MRITPGFGSRFCDSIYRFNRDFASLLLARFDRFDRDQLPICSRDSGRCGEQTEQTSDCIFKGAAIVDCDNIVALGSDDAGPLEAGEDLALGLASALGQPLGAHRGIRGDMGNHKPAEPFPGRRHHRPGGIGNDCSSGT